jgi:hypothetical protein
MKTHLALALVATLTFCVSTATAADRACRPSLSNFYHCPGTSPPATKTAPTSVTSPSTSQSRQRGASTARPCRPSLSNGYSCAGTPSQSERPSTPSKTTSAAKPECRPSLSNGFKCPSKGETGANQYATEMKAWAHCPSDTVVWANTRSNIYHFRGTSNYGNTVAGAYMCEQDALAGGIRAAKNERHP